MYLGMIGIKDYYFDNSSNENGNIISYDKCEPFSSHELQNDNVSPHWLNVLFHHRTESVPVL